MKYDTIELKEIVEKNVKKHVLSNQKNQKTKYRDPIIGFSTATDPLYLHLKEITIPHHYLPQDLLKNAKTVISIFLPFSEEIIQGNSITENSSKAWAIGYTETNELLDSLSRDLADELQKMGYPSISIKTTHHLSHAKKEYYAYEELFDKWSQKHVGYISGIGKFGLNNLIITVRGCAGRLGSLVTSAEIEITQRDTDSPEYCLVKRGEFCYKCIDNCPVKVMTSDGKFDRVGCMNYLVKQRKYQESVYGMKEGTQTCGKCSVNIPCASRIP
ncbi:MAG: epoxyqueuosine reductase [Candidatus Bathyarchaeota archaeon]